VQRWKEERSIWREQHLAPWSEEVEQEYYQRFGTVVDDWLDTGYGSCCLAQPKNAEIVANALLYFNEDRYLISNFVVMPNHVHVLFRPLGDHQLAQIIGLWKSFTAKKINHRTHQVGSIWQANYWDRLIRSAEHLQWTENYIQQNPVNLQAGKYYLWRNAGLTSPTGLCE